MDVNLQKMTINAAEMSGMIGMKVLDLTLDTMTETGSELVEMINAVPAVSPSVPAAPSGVMNADHIDITV